MVRDPNYDRYEGIVSLEDPVNPRKRRPFRVDEDGNVLYKDAAPEIDGIANPAKRSSAGILGWDELDHRLGKRLALPTEDIVPTGARSSAANSAPPENLVNPRKRANGIDYEVIGAKTFDPSRSSNITSAPNDDMMWAANANRRDVAVEYGVGERGAFLTRKPLELPWADRLKVGRIKFGEDEPYSTVPLKDSYFSVPLINPKTRSTEFADTLNFGPRKSFPEQTIALNHGHIDNGPLDKDGQRVQSDGMVDHVVPGDRNSYGDSAPLIVGKPLPLATTSNGQVGWHFLENGQLKFMYPVGSVDERQREMMQQNLDTAQTRYQDKLTSRKE